VLVVPPPVVVAGVEARCGAADVRAGTGAAAASVCVFGRAVCGAVATVCEACWYGVPAVCRWE
jgi:endonuclease III